LSLLKLEFGLVGCSLVYVVCSLYDVSHVSSVYYRDVCRFIEFRLTVVKGFVGLLILGCQHS